MTAAQAVQEPPRHILLPSGKPIRFRGFQMGVWTAIGIFLGPALIAGIYFALFQVNWYVHIGPVHFEIFYLKPWWDKRALPIFPRKVWPLYRHAAFRDLLEPAAAIMYIKTFLVKPKYWDLKASAVRMALTPPALLVAAILMGCLGVWLLDFGGPDAWHHLFGHNVLTGPVITALGRYSVGILLWGIGMGLVLHRFWAPVGSTIQGYYIDKAVDRTRLAEQGTGQDSWYRRGLSSVTGFLGDIPLWVRYPAAPPVIRERFSWMFDHDTEVSEHGTTSKWLIVLISVVVVLLTALGILARYWFAKGHHLPYLYP